jgi:hypothetical protein
MISRNSRKSCAARKRTKIPMNLVNLKFNLNLESQIIDECFGIKIWSGKLVDKLFSLQIA